jgi:small ligand-binding sensory domain FIST
MPTTAPAAAVALSGHLDTRTAATEVADRLFDELGSSRCDLLLVFGSFHHRSAFEEAAAIVRRTLDPQAMIGVTAEAVLGEDRELEGLAGLSALALQLPRATITPWHATPDDPMPLRDPAGIRRRIGYERDDPSRFKAAIMFGDPFSTPITRLLPAISRCPMANDELRMTNGKSHSETDSHSSFVTGHSSFRPVPVIGGMASGASQPNLNVLVLNDRVFRAGAVGVSLAGDFDIDFVVSQGCRPIGQPMVITKARSNFVLELGARRAMDVLQEMAQELSDAEKRLLSRGLFVGHVINEYKSHFGRGDFVIRSVMGFDQRSGGIGVGEMCRVGQTIQFHVRDAATATEDLQLLLDAQVMHDTPPFASLLFTCNGRGERLFGEPSHDLSIIRKRLGGDLAIAGFHAAGEFGPIGDRSFLHGHTASLALLRAADTA